MAEVTAMRNNALPYPVYGAPFTLVFPILDADGDPVTSAAGLDSEVSKNGNIQQILEFVVCCHFFLLF